MSQPTFRPGEKAAYTARLELGLGNDTPISILDAVEEIAGVPVCVAAFDNEIAGLYLESNGQPVLFVNGTHPVARQRFTLAHEFGHWKMQHKPRVELSSAMMSRQPQEIEANDFAGAFLAPRQAVRHWVERDPDIPIDLNSIVRMAEYFGISAEAARIRLEVSGVLGPSPSRRLKAEIKHGWHRGRQGELGLQGYADGLSRLKRDVTDGRRALPRLPAAMVREALRARERDLLDDEDLAALLRGTNFDVSIEEDELVS